MAGAIYKNNVRYGGSSSSSYDDTEIQQKVSDLETSVENVYTKDETDEIIGKVSDGRISIGSVVDSGTPNYYKVSNILSVVKSYSGGHVDSGALFAIQARGTETVLLSVGKSDAELIVSAQRLFGWTGDNISDAKIKTLYHSGTDLYIVTKEYANRLVIKTLMGVSTDATIEKVDTLPDDVIEIVISNTKDGGNADTVDGWHIYSSLSELGLDEATATVEGIVNAMPNNSMLLHKCGASATTSALALPFNYGLLQVTKATVSYVDFVYSMLNQRYYGYYNGGASRKWSGWTTQFLPLNGGTIEKEAATLLTLKNTTETAGISRIAFSNSNGLLGCIGMGSSADKGLRRYTSDLSAGYIVLDTGNLAEYTKNSAIYANLQVLCTAFGLEAKQYTTEELFLALPNNVNIVFDHYMLTDSITVTDFPMNYGLVEIIKTSDINRNAVRFTSATKGNLYLWHYHETEVSAKVWRKVDFTSVTDISKTNITYSNTANYAIATQEYNWYMVKNGICYYSLYVTVSTVSNTWVEAITGLPVSTNTMISAVPPFADYASNPSGLAYSINNNGSISFRNGVVGNTYLVSGSYPVAE